MAKNINYVSHKKSKVKVNGKPQLPSADSLVEGEIAVNFAENVETLSIKNESGAVVTFSSDNYYSEQKLGSAFTGANSAVTVTDELSNKANTSDIDDLVGSGFTSSSITDVIIENEEIVSNALIDLDERKLDASAYTPTDLSNYYTKSETSGATELTTAFGTKVDSSTFTAHTASTVHMNSTEKTNLDSLATNIAAISGITSTKVSNWDTAYTNRHTHSNRAALDSITGSVGTMAYQATSSYSSATEVQTALNSKANTATTLAGYGITDAYTKSETSGKTEIENALNAKVNTDDIVTAITPSNSGSTNPIATKVVAENELIVSNALTDLDERKLDASAYTPTDLSNYYTKSETSGATEIANALSGKSNTSHTHDDRYYTESELTGSSTTVVVAKANSASTVPLAGVTNADDLKAIEALSGNNGLLKKTAANTWSLDTNTYSTTASAVTSGVYNSTNQKIELKNASGTVVSSIDATDFIKDGMISGVTLESKSGTTYLVINWNTDAGIQTTELNIGDIFEADNYYTKSETSGKTEIQNALTAKTDTATTTALNNVVTAHTANTTVHITAAERTSWNAVTAKTDNSAFTAHTASTVHMNNTEKTNLDSLATNIAAISGITSTKVGNWDTAYTNNHTHSNKTALDSITSSVGTMAYQNASSYSSATQVNTALEGKVNTTEYAAFSASTNDSINDLSGQSQTIAAAINDLNDNKLDITAYTPTDLSNYYTKSETSGKTEISTALSGKADVDDVEEMEETLVASITDVESRMAEKTALSALADEVNEVKDEVDNKLDATDAYTKTEIDNMIGDIETLLATI